MNKIARDRRDALRLWAKNLRGKTTARVMIGGIIHKQLMRSAAGMCRFTDLRDSPQGAGQLQKTLILGLLSKKDKRFLITETGRRALTQLNVAKDFGETGKLCYVPIKPSRKWIEHAQTNCW